MNALPVFQNVFTWIHDVSEHIMGAIIGMSGVTVEPWIISMAAFGLAAGLVFAIVSKVIKHLGYAAIASVVIVAIIFFIPLSPGH